MYLSMQALCMVFLSGFVISSSVLFLRQGKEGGAQPLPSLPVAGGCPAEGEVHSRSCREA